MTIQGALREKGGSGRPSKLLNDAAKSKMAKDVARANGPSQRDLAEKYGISQPYVNKILQESGMKAFKKTKVPYSTEKQKEKQVQMIDRLYRQLCNSPKEMSIVMDDESYFCLSHPKIGRNQ